MANQYSRLLGVTAMLSVADVAARLKVSRYTVVRMIGAGKLAASKVGRQWRIDPAAVDEMLRPKPNLATLPERFFR